MLITWWYRWCLFIAANISYHLKIYRLKIYQNCDFFDIHSPRGVKLITRLRLGLSHLREHSFQDTINPLSNCGQDIESATHFFLHCPFFINERRTLLSTIRSLDSKLLHCTDYDLTQTLHFGSTSQTSSNNFKIINASVGYILPNKIFHIYLLLLYIYLLLLLVILYSQVLSCILLSRDGVILCPCVFFLSIFYKKWNVNL